MRQFVCCFLVIFFSHLFLCSCSNDGGSDGKNQLKTYIIRYEFTSPYIEFNLTYWDENNERIFIASIDTEHFTYAFKTSKIAQTIGIIGNYNCIGPYCSSVNRPVTVNLYIDDVLVATAYDSGAWPEAAIGPEPLSNFLDLLTPELEPEPRVTITLDAFIANFLSPSMVLWNDGFGHFSLSEQSTWMMANRDVAIGDLDDDSDLDAFVVASTEGCCDTNQIYLVDEFGSYFYKPQTISTFGAYNSYGVALGDLDGDADLDAFVANYAEPNKVYFNEGLGIFSDSGQSLGLDNSYDVALDDLDGDGDIDAFIVNNEEPNKIYLNDGNGYFADSGQALDDAKSRNVALDDLDGDGDIDAFIVNYGEPNKFYLNDGNGTFSDSGQLLGIGDSTGIALGDLNGDTYIDGFVVNNAQANRIFLNDGSGVFTDSGQALGLFESTSIDMGDVDGDGDLDAVVTNANSQPNKLYFNNGVGFFTDSGQELGRGDSKCVVLGKINP